MKIVVSQLIEYCVNITFMVTLLVVAHPKKSMHISVCFHGFSQVKKTICYLIKQNIASYEKNKKGNFEYTIQPSNVLIRLRFPRFMYSAKSLYGDVAELLVMLQ